MKSFFIFIAGMITMLVIVFGIYNNLYMDEGHIPGLTYLSEQQTGDVFNYKNIVVLQAHSQNTALVWPKDKYEPVMFLIGNETDAFYDRQIINVPNGYKLVQVGTYRYTNREKIEKTVPAVAILKK